MDIIILSFTINYNFEGKENTLVEKCILYFTTLEDINISLKNNIENLINEYYPNIPKDFIKVVDVISNTNFIFHDYPPIEILQSNNYEFVQYRDWDIEMNRLSDSKNTKKDNDTHLNKTKYNIKLNEIYVKVTIINIKKTTNIANKWYIYDRI